MSQGNVAGHEGVEGNTKLACRRAMWLGTKVPKATQSLCVAERCGWARRCRREHKACVSQGNVIGHEGVEGNTKLACCKALWLGTWVLKASLAPVDGWVPNDGGVLKESLAPIDG
ncbi:unnamed protein product [Prunus armeniaca]